MSRPPAGKLVQFRLPGPDVERLDAFAAAAGLSRSEAIRRAVLRDLDRRERALENDSDLRRDR